MKNEFNRGMIILLGLFLSQGKHIPHIFSGIGLWHKSQGPGYSMFLKTDPE